MVAADKKTSDNTVIECSYKYVPEMCNLPFLRLLINHDYPVFHPDWIKQIDFKKLVALWIIHG